MDGVEAVLRAHPTPSAKLALNDDGGRVRSLRYTNMAIVRLEEDTGFTIAQMERRISAGSVKALGQLVHAGLLHEDKTLTLEYVLERLPLKRVEELAEAVGTALATALGKEDAPEGKVQEPDQVLT